MQSIFAQLSQRLTKKVYEIVSLCRPLSSRRPFVHVEFSFKKSV